jgi:hypothetical protein
VIDATSVTAMTADEINADAAIADVAAADGDLTLEFIEADFWTSRDELQLIYRAALSRMCSPWAVLACCTARVLCLVPPAIVLPPFIGGPGSLNWFAVISAKSGGGKGAAMRVAAHLVNAEINIRGVGSGEGMVEVYQRGASKLKDPPPPVVAVLFSIGEVDALGAMSNRSGQTTMAIIRDGFFGDTLGYSYRGRQSEIVPEHTYRMTLIVAVQPERAGVLLDDAGGGTPQRFMWFPGRDKRITAQPPKWPIDDYGRDQVLKLLSVMDLAHAAGEVQIPDIAAQEIRDIRAASMSGDDNALDGHSVFCREKLAYALGYLNGHTEIDDEDWRLSGIAATVSDWCRAKAQDGYVAGKRRQSRDRGLLRGVEMDSADIERFDLQEQRSNEMKLWVIGQLAKAGTEGLPFRDLNHSITKSKRPFLQPTLDRLRDDGLITQDATTKRWVVNP